MMGLEFSMFIQGSAVQDLGQKLTGAANHEESYASYMKQWYLVGY